MSLRRFLTFQFAYWAIAALLLFIYGGVVYGHWSVALVRNLYFPVMAFGVSFGLAAIYRVPKVRSSDLHLAWVIGLSALAGLLTALILNPITFGLAQSGWIHQPVRILSTDTLYFILFYLVWSLLFQRLDETQHAPKTSATEYLSEIEVEDSSGRKRLQVGQVQALLASGDYVELVAGQKSFLVSATLSGLLERLDPDDFVRVHRSVAVGRVHVASVVPQPRGAFDITLTSGRVVTSSRSFKDAVAGLLPPA